MPAELHLLRPQWLLALIPLAVLLWWLVRRPGAGDVWRGVVDAHLLAHLVERGGGGMGRLPLVLLAIGWILIVVALAGPAWEQLPRPVYQTDARRVIALDISETMNAEDVPPSRLVRARFEVLDLLERASEGQTALLAYGAEPFVVSPLTKDAQTIAAQVPDLVSDLLPVQGPARADLALALAGDLLARAGSQAGDVILVTGDVDDDRAARQAAADLRDRGYRVSVLGIGTEKGAPVPKLGGGFLTDESGAILLPRLDPGQLADLASAGGGIYRTASADDSDTRALIPPAGPGSERAEAMDARADQWREEGPWLLLGVLVLAALAFRRGWLSPLVLMVLFLPHPPAQALDWEDLWLRPDQQAARAFAAGAHREAANQFRRPDWRAAAEYEAGDYAEALDALEGLEGMDTLYNRGNALARLGRFQDAIDDYERVLAGDPDHADARHNRDLLRDLLARQEAQDRSEQPPSGGEPPPEGEGSEEDGAGKPEDDGGETGGGEGEGEGTEEGGSGTGGDGPSSEPGGAPSEPAPESGGQSGEDGQAEATPGPHDREDAGGGEGVDGPPAAAETASGDAPDQQQRPAPGEGREAGAGDEPDASDLLGEGTPSQGAVGDPSGQTAPGEQDQATEHLLRRVPDDPGGLLRQRFLLQHLRRSGRLP